METGMSFASLDENSSQYMKNMELAEAYKKNIESEDLIQSLKLMDTVVS